MQEIATTRSQSLQHRLKPFAIVIVFMIRMGSGHDVANAILSRDPAHFGCLVPRGGAVINLRQDVTVEVDHSHSVRLDDHSGSVITSRQVAGRKSDLGTL